MFTKKTLKDVDVSGKRVLLRVDFNVPLDEENRVEDDTRIRSSLPTINHLIEKDAKIIIISHLGRPGGKFDPKYKLDPVARKLSELLGREVKKVDKTVSEDVEEAVSSLDKGDLIVLENIRFNPKETVNDEGFSEKLASLGEVFVNDAFGASHRSHASTVGVTKFLPAVAGFLMESEVKNLSKLLENPEKPFYTVLGGNKCSDKIGVIENFINTVDGILIGGGMCFTFLKAKGYSIGDSVCQNDFIGIVREIMKKASQKGVRLHMPADLVVAKEIKKHSEHKVVDADDIPDGWAGVDIGPKTRELFKKELQTARTVFWNGPMGVFEIDPFSHGTRTICETLVEMEGTKIVGGGDSDSALRKFGAEEKMTFVSTGGGACLKLLEGSELPGVNALLDK